MSTCPQASSLETILAKKCGYTHGRTLIYTKYGLRISQSKMLGQRKPRRKSHKMIRTTRTWCSGLDSVCLRTCTLFPPNKCFTCFTSFCFSVEIHFLEMNRNGQDSALGQTSISAQKRKSYFKSLQVEVTQAQICLDKNLCLCSWKRQQQQQGDLRGSTDSR